MKKRLLILFLVIAILSTMLVACDPHEEDKPPVVPVADKTVTETKVVTYDGPQVLSSSQVATVKVEGKELFVYDTRVNHKRSFTWTASNDYNQVVIFDFEGRVNVEIEISDVTALYNVVVRPLSYGVEPTVAGNKISFTLDYTDNYVVEYGLTETDRASANAIHIFANPIETDTIDPDNVPENTVYIGPGVYMANSLPATEDNTTIYLAGGAVVYGQIRTGNVDNLTIRGRGIISGAIYNRTKSNEFTLPIELQDCSNVTIKDIAILDPAGWAVTLYHCDNVNIDNLKIITARSNGDGISVQSCSNVNVTGGFVRTWDDSLVVKNVDLLNTSDITFDGVYVWTDLAQSMEVGYETYGAKMENITFKNITVLHNFHKAAMSIHNADQAQITNVTYENITIEDAQMLGDNQKDGENDFLIDMTIAYNTEWTQSGAERGSVRNVTFKNIKVIEMADSIICRAIGEGVSSCIDGVTVSNVEIEGELCTSLESIGLTPGVFTNNFRYTNSGTIVSGAMKMLPYKLELAANDSAQITENANIAQDGIEIPDFAMVKTDPSYAGRKVDLSGVTVTATYGAGDRSNSPWDLDVVTSSESNPLSNLTDGNRATEWTFNAWKNEQEYEFVAINFEFDKATQVGNIRFLGSEMSNIMRTYNVAVFAKTMKTDKDGNELGLTDWTRKEFGTDISLSPQSSNYVDFLINSSGFYGIQLRFFHKTGITYPETITLGEIEFYPPSLTTNKSFKEVADYEDVYHIEYMIDGNTNTYFESKKGVFPASFAIDMAEVANVKYINIHLPPNLLWEPRTQEIEILGSLNGTDYTTVVAKATYTFDAMQGNMVSITLDTAVAMRYIKFVYYSNSTGYGAQISELYVFGE